MIENWFDLQIRDCICPGWLKIQIFRRCKPVKKSLIFTSFYLSELVINIILNRVLPHFNHVPCVLYSISVLV